MSEKKNNPIDEQGICKAFELAISNSMEEVMNTYYTRPISNVTPRLLENSHAATIVSITLFFSYGSALEVVFEGYSHEGRYWTINEKRSRWL